MDNLRWLCVLMLIPYHTFMIYNSFGENFYIKGPDIPITTGFITVTWPWFMPLLFVLAGISSAYALQKRTAREYVAERVYRLLIPLVCGVLLLLPAQTYFAERFHNGYSGGYFEQYALFFTKPTDLTGYTGGFTPGHLWFILYLFVISLAALPIMKACQRRGKRLHAEKIPLPAMLALFILPLLGALVLDIGGKSLGEYFAYFMLGYLILPEETVLVKMDKCRWPLLGASIAGMVVMWLGSQGFLAEIPDLAVGIFSRFYAWTTILAFLGLGRHCLNFTNRVTGYLSRSSFAIYVFHQTCLVAAAYYVFEYTDIIVLQMALIMAATALASFALYALCRRTRVTRLLFGIND